MYLFANSIKSTPASEIYVFDLIDRSKIFYPQQATRPTASKLFDIFI